MDPNVPAKRIAWVLSLCTASTWAFYLVDEFYAPELERGIRWDDPRFGIHWPLEPVVISEKDRGHRTFDPAWHLGAGADQKAS